MDIAEIEVANVARITVVPTILEVVCRTLGMGFAAVAHVTDQRWIACAVRDEIAFGLRPGGELELSTTICHEIRQHGQAVVIDDVAADSVYCGHPTPARYGFRSYISVPILRPDGTFFGTLCAIDPEPVHLRLAGAESMLRLYAQLIGFHLDAQERMAASEAALAAERPGSWSFSPPPPRPGRPGRGPGPPPAAGPSCASSSSPCWVTISATPWRRSTPARGCWPRRP